MIIIYNLGGLLFGLLGCLIGIVITLLTGNLGVSPSETVCPIDRKTGRDFLSIQTVKNSAPD